MKRIVMILLSLTLFNTSVFANENCIKNETEKTIGALFGFGIGAVIGGPAGVLTFAGISALLETTPMCEENNTQEKNYNDSKINETQINEEKNRINIPTMLFVEKVFHFGLNEYKETKEELNKDIINLKADYLVTSHASQPGTNQYNMELSKKRSNTIVNYLINNGIELSKIKIKNYGESMLICEEETIECYNKNQRSEVRLIISEEK